MSLIQNSPTELKEKMVELNIPGFRASQVFNWIHNKAVLDYSKMSNLSLELRKELEEKLPIPRLKILQIAKSKDGTKKYLFGLSDGYRIETVLMNHRESTGHIRHTVCLSSQAGCAMGCSFCQTGKLGLKRSLSADEIILQVLELTNSERIQRPDFTVSNLVYMGMGEPMDNLDNVLKSIRILNDSKGQNIGIRRITVSTCGVVPGIERLSKENLDITLAISLHSPFNDERSSMMPVNKAYPLEVLFEALKKYQGNGGRRITFEYVMLEGVNIDRAHARVLAGLVRNLTAHVNLIPVNAGNHEYIKPKEDNQKLFLKYLNDEKIPASIREEKGSDIAGACGQLAAKGDEAK